MGTVEDKIKDDDLSKITSFPKFYSLTERFIRNSYDGLVKLNAYELAIVIDVPKMSEYVSNIVGSSPLDYSKKYLPELEKLANPELKSKAFDRFLKNHIKEDEILTFHEKTLITLNNSMNWLENYKDKISHSDDLYNELGTDVAELQKALKGLYTSITKKELKEDTFSI